MALTAFGLHKGYALATMCEILGGALSGGRTTHDATLLSGTDAIFNGMTTIILNPDAFDAPAMQQEAEEFLAWVRRSPQSGEAEILVPGEWKRAIGQHVNARAFRWTATAGSRFAQRHAELACRRTNWRPSAP